MQHRARWRRLVATIVGSTITSGSPGSPIDRQAQATGIASEEAAMSLPRIATREEWLAARKELLAKEKNLTRQRDARRA
jgi:Bacterial protein of unknown function (DUF899)